MPEYMDVHEGMMGITKEALAEAHQADLDIQDDEGAFHDIDTPAEYEAVLAKLTARDR